MVDIVTRHDTHRALAELTIARGVATIVQKPFAPSWEDCVAIVEAARSGGRLARGARELPLPGADAARAAADRRRRDRRRRAGRASASAPASMSIATQPYFYDEERLAIADVGIHVLDLARFLLGEVGAHLLRDAAAQPEGARPRTPRPCCCGTRSGAVSVVECTYEARRTPGPVPRDAARDRGRRAARSSSMPGCRMTRDSVGRPGWEEDIGAPLLPWTSAPVARQPGGRARRLPAFPRSPAGGRAGGDVRRRQPQDLRAGRCGLPGGGNRAGRGAAQPRQGAVRPMADRGGQAFGRRSTAASP